MTKKINNTITPASFKRGIVSAVYINNWTADVSIIGSTATTLKGIPISKALTASTVQAGMKCRVDFFSENVPGDAVLAYTY